MNETFRPSPPITAIRIAIAPIDAAAILRDHDLLVLGVVALADDARPDVVRHRARRAEHEPRDDGEDRRERDAGDHREEQVAAERARAAAELRARGSAPRGCRPCRRPRRRPRPSRRARRSR